jgi:DNA polymerase alpha-associated DNA helicase A
VLAGDPMQLPPTVLSLEKHQKKEKLKQRPKISKQQKPVSETIDSGSEADVELPGAPDDTKTDELLPPYSLSQTLFRRLDKAHGAKIKVMLNTQYRSAKDFFVTRFT